MKQGSNRFAWLDWTAPWLAMAGIWASLVPEYLRTRLSQVPASDFKTLIASVKLLVERSSPYSVPALQQMFVRNIVVQPFHWYGHMPVYPPFTLAVLAPLARLDLVQASWFWLTFSSLALAFALCVLMQSLRRDLGIGIIGRFVTLALCVICPLLGFALDVANVSVVVASLCIVAAFLKDRELLRGALLAVALLLKPHIALWIWLAMLFFKAGGWSRVAMWAAGIGTAFVALCSTVFWFQGRLGFLWRSYFEMLHAEARRGSSMSAASHEFLPEVSQITSVWSIGGYFGGVWYLLPVIILVVAVLALAWSAWRLRNDGGIEVRSLVAGAFFALGMIASYHRAHDALTLLVLVPWILYGVQRQWWEWVPAFVCFAGLSVDLGIGGGFWQYRQGALTSLALTMVLAVMLLREAKKGRYER